VRLERTHLGQRLMVEDGAEQFEIGTHLREPEREWLAEILAAWAAPQAEERSAPPSHPVSDCS